MNRPEKTVQWLGGALAPTEDLGSVPSSHMTANNNV